MSKLTLTVATEMLIFSSEIGGTTLVLDIKNLPSWNLPSREIISYAESQT